MAAVRHADIEGEERTGEGFGDGKKGRVFLIQPKCPVCVLVELGAAGEERVELVLWVEDESEVEESRSDKGKGGEELVERCRGV
jgi:hypothetical protein